MCEICPRIRQVSRAINVPIIINALLLHNIQIRVSSSGYVNVLQWNREWFFSPREKFDSGFNVMAVYETSRHGPKIVYRFPASGSESWGGGRDPSDSPRKSLLLSPWIGRGRIKVDVLSSWFPPGVLIRPSAIGNKFSLFGKYHLFSHWVFSSRIPMRPSSPIPEGLQSVRHPSKFLPAWRAYPRNNPGKTFFPNWWIRDWSFAVVGWYSTNEPNGTISPLNGRPKRLS